MKNLKWMMFLFLAILTCPVLRVSAQESDKQSLYLQAIKADPNNVAAHFNLGVSYLNEQKFDLAVPEFQKCIQLNSKDNEARGYLEFCQGMIASSKGDTASAMDHFQNALKFNPNDLNAKRFLEQYQAKYYMDQKNYPAAVTALSHIVQDDPQNFGAYQNLGFIYFQQKDYKKAVDYWTQSIKLHPESQIYKFLGFSYYNLGDFKNAIDHYKKSIELESAKDPKEQDTDSLDATYYDLGVAYNDNASYDESAEAFGNAFKVNPKDSNAAVAQAQAIDAAVNSHNEKASNFILSNQYSDAISEWQKVLKYQPDNQQAKAFIADAQGKLDAENKKNLNKLAHVKALVAQGDEFYAAQDYSGALASYNKAKGIDPHNSMVRARLKKLLSKQTSEIDTVYSKAIKAYSKGDLKNAQKYISLAKEIAPTSEKIGTAFFKIQKDISVKVKALDDDGVSLFDGGDKDKAKIKFQEVLKLKSDDSTANDYIKRMTGQQAQEKVDAEKVKALYYDGVNLYINGKIHEAIEKWQECLKQDPNNINAQNNINKAMVKLQSIEKLSHD